MASRKEEHKLAGKRMLEEFRNNRKKKAGDQSKKIAPKSQPQVADVNTHEPQPLETELLQHINSNGSDLVINENKNGKQDSSNFNPLRTNENNAFSVELQHTQTHAKDQEFVRYNDNNQKIEMNDDFSNSNTAQERFSNVNIADQTIGLQSTSKGLTGSNPAIADALSTNAHTEKNATDLLKNKYDYDAMLPNGHASSLFEAKMNDSASEAGNSMDYSTQLNNYATSDMNEKHSNYLSGLHSAQSNDPSLMSESVSGRFSFDVRSSSNHEPVYPSTSETKSRRPRSTFLDSLNVSRTSSTAPFSATRSNTDGFSVPTSSKLYSTAVLGSSVSQMPLTETNMKQPFSESEIPSLQSTFDNSVNSSMSFSSGADPSMRIAVENRFERNYKYDPPKHDDDFSALEQHIEDLTQEKFSLQRAVEASRALAESLAVENSSLTESYNQQGSVINQLKSEMEILQEEIKIHQAELESVKIEYGNVLLECDAADERAKLLASEVIGLEEKALRLRSNELKLERQLENTSAEMASYKKKMSSQEKDRQDLLLTIEALQEEKKLLQSKIQKASVSGKSIDATKSLAKKIDASTSTEDLDPVTDNFNNELHNAASDTNNDASSSTVLPERRDFIIEESSVNIPPDQMRMIHSVNLLISELALEKEELINAFAAESSHSLKLKELNKQLTQKLETQTQRLELLTAQSMANRSISTRPSDSHNSPASNVNLNEDVPTYADEGDEVVERVLGWIMNLFPGGPSKRRTSKLL